MSGLNINTGSTHNNIINPSVTPTLKFEGKFNYPVITLGSSGYNGGLYSYNGGRSWDAPDTLGYNPEYTFIGASALGSYMNMSPNLQDVCIWSWITSGGGGSIKHLSHDAGRTWESTYYASSNFEYSHFNKDNNTMYLGGWAGGAQKSIDAGETLSGLTMVNSRQPITFDSSDDESYVYAGIANSREVQYSTNQGSSWTSVSVTGGGTNHRICKCDATGQYVFAYYGNYSTSANFSDDYGQTYSLLSDSVDARVALRRDGSCFVYTSAHSSKIYFSTNQGSSWTSVTNPFGTDTTTAVRQDYTNNEIYLFARSSNEIYRVNDDGDGLELLKTLDANIWSFDCSQYGRGFVYTQNDGGSLGDIYFSRNSQTWELIKEDDGSNIGGYLMVL